ncbi:hypothetical protein [Streptomyces sp. NRRL F-2890]|uniref:hypothetical protein n=1 Tax=Streptomyces sp. NRRL F-2890 TaxID=1463845 RepID=UPI0004C67B98|nr:hypothetical protein [Streptomyces sp. NRRL F-2890]
MRQVSPGRWECQNPDCSALNIETGRHTPAVTADSREPLPIRKPGATNPPNLPPINQPRQHNHRNQADEALHRARKARRTTRSPEGCSRSARDLGGASPAQHPHINSAAISVGR